MSSPSESPETGTGNYLSHLVELRMRLIKAIAAVVVVFAGLCVWPGTNVVYDILAAPMVSTLPQNATMIATGVITPFMVPVKVTMLLAFVLALPVVIYQMWAFVAPGLYKHEKRLVLPLVLISTLLFFMGMAFCYFVVFRTVFHFVAMVSPSSVTFAPDIEAYLSFVMTMFLVFGITFEVPVAVIILVAAGIVSFQKMRQARRYVIVFAFVIAAILTPPDVISQLMMAIPICLLYEAGLFFARFIRLEAKEAAREEHNRS